MKRRHFFNVLGGFVAGCALAVHAVSRLPQRIINPAWVDAPYEMQLIVFPEWQSSQIAMCNVRNGKTYCIKFHQAIFDQLDPTENICETVPRFDANGNRVPRFVVG